VVSDYLTVAESDNLYSSCLGFMSLGGHTIESTVNLSGAFLLARRA